MKRRRGVWPTGIRVVTALICGFAILFPAVTIATDAVGGNDSTPSGEFAVASGATDGTDTVGGTNLGRDGRPLSAWISTHDRVLAHEALPCTGPNDPTNFEIFSAGPAVAGLPLSATVRRCDTDAPAYEAPANRITYIYGHCETPPEGETGCAPPLEVQTWPACQRNRAGYSFEGEPLPYRELPRHGAAEVVEFDFALENRVEVYTKSSTIVIFADSPELGRKAVEFLTPQEVGKPPVTNAADLQGSPPEGLEPPTEGAMKGDLRC